LNSFNLYSKNILFLESEFLPFYIKNIPFFFSILGIFLVYFFNIYFLKFYNKLNKKQKYFYYSFYRFFSYKWYIDVLYNKIIVKYFFNISYSYVKYIDRGLIELIGPLGIVRSLNFFMLRVNLIQTGFLYNYIFLFILSIIFILLYFLNFINIDSEFLILYLILFFKKNEVFKNNTNK